MKTFLLAALTATLCAACASMQIAPPDVTLTDIRLGEITFLETSLIATVRIQNEETRAFEIDGASYRLYLNGIDVGKGTSDQRLSVPRLSSAQQRVVFRLNNLSFITKIQSLVESRDFSYRIDGKLYLPGGFGLGRSISVRREGRFDLSPMDHPQRHYRGEL